MRVLIVIGSDLKRFKDTGGDDPLSPRLPLSYPFYGYLKDKNFHVEVLSINNVTWEGSDRKLLFKLIGYISLVFRTFYFFSFDLIISSGFIGVFLSYLLIPMGLSKKICVIVYANKSPEPRTLLTKLKDAIFQYGLKLCGAVIYITKKQRDEAVNEIGIPAQAAYLMPIGVDTNFFTTSEIQDVTCIRDAVQKAAVESYVVVSGDQMRNENLIADIIKSSGLRLVRLTQSVSVEKFWRKIIKETPEILNVFCKAHLNFQEVRFLYQHALCVLNLVDNSWQPAGWTVLTEAMACGVPVIMNKGLVTEEMKSYNGNPDIFEVDAPINVTEIVKLLQKLKADPKLAKDAGTKGKEFVRQYFMIEKSGDSLVQIVKQVCKKKLCV